MRIVRLDELLEARLEEAARITGEPILGQRLDRRLRDVVGLVRSRGGRVRRTGEAFAEQLRRKKTSGR